MKQYRTPIKTKTEPPITHGQHTADQSQTDHPTTMQHSARQQSTPLPQRAMDGQGRTKKEPQGRITGDTQEAATNKCGEAYRKRANQRHMQRRGPTAHTQTQGPRHGQKLRTTPDTKRANRRPTTPQGDRNGRGRTAPTHHARQTDEQRQPSPSRRTRPEPGTAPQSEERTPTNPHHAARQAHTTQRTDTTSAERRETARQARNRPVPHGNPEPGDKEPEETRHPGNGTDGTGKHNHESRRSQILRPLGGRQTARIA